ncbi:hypothetical protein PHYBOEH_010908 [Phytophthora boehmeriae]|uniref:Fungal lipase-type domain-containing protein n=1 Tax=Phytophthora boehmeriae TaxID=109152 RepID=A0A8T1X049_9STRA|nr:hypothetical protein PHYBOEH_010908 [Phytophthora boehmeriae]
MRFLCALLLLCPALAVASNVWEPSFPVAELSRPRLSSRDHHSVASPAVPVSTSPLPDNNSSYNATTALYLAHVTSVSYCLEKHIIDWNCQPCSLVPRLENVQVVEDAKDNFQGLVGYSPSYQAIVIAFRGSMDVTNWLDNLTFLKRRAYPEFPGVMVHMGFYWAWKSVSDQVLTILKKLQILHPHAKLLVSGHSLGGAVAAICAFELEFVEKMTVQALYTFGKPRVGNINFSGYLHNATMEVYRLTHFNDVVPHLPPTWTGFQHTTQEIFYNEFSENYRRCSQSDGEDPTCSNACSPFGCTSIVDHLTYLNITMSHLIC